MAGDEGTPEPRRSGRSTKGQHTRNAELNEEPPAKKPVPVPPITPASNKKTNTKATPASTRSSKKKDDKASAASPETATAEEEEEDDDGEVIRCICGADTDDGGRQMICCDQCEVWQHSSCMQIPTKKTPDHYYCEQCKPELHKDLLEKIARGEKPWEKRSRKGSRKSIGSATKKKKGSEAPDTPAPEGQEDEKDDEKDEDTKMDSPAATMTTEAEKDTEEPAQDTVVDNLDEVLDPALKEEKTEDTEMKEPEEIKPKEEEQPEQMVVATGRRRSSVASPSTLKRKADEAVEETTPDAKESSPARKTSIPQSPSQPKSTKTRSGRRSSTTASKPPPPKKPKMADNQLEQQATIDDLKSDTRRKGAETLRKFLESSLKSVDKLPEGETSKAEFAARLALEIEHHTYILLSAQTAGEPNDDYRQKFRSILFNLKKNEPLLSNVLTKKLGTKEFSDMTGDEMATEDMKHIVQEAEKESEKQSILTVEASGPRIRRTHKGEEIVGEDTGMIAENSSGFIGSRYEPPAEKSDDEHNHSAPPSPGAEDHEMTDRPRSPSPTIHNETDTPSKALKIDTSKQAPGPGHHRRTSSFDIHNVWSNVESTDAGHRGSIPRPPITPLTAHPANGNNAQLDRDIDMLLRNDGSADDAGSETPPYSPRDYTDGDAEGVVWKGKILMRGVADFDAQALHVAGPDLWGNNNVPWDTVIGKSIEITGRISVDRANEYLQQLKFSSRSSDVVVFSLQPRGTGDSTASFQRLYEHFKERQRSGVVGNVSWAPTKDVYVVAVGKGENMPKYMLNTAFPGHPREQDALLLCIVFNRSLEPFLEGQAGFTPVLAGRNAQTPVLGWAGSPTPAAFQGTPPLAQAGVASMAPAAYQPSQTPVNAAGGNPNVVEQLMRLLKLGPADQIMLREIIERNPGCENDSERLMRLVAEYKA